jgi:hypothetical protein
MQATLVSALPEQGEACELAGVTHMRQAKLLSTRIRTQAYTEKYTLNDGTLPQRLTGDTDHGAIGKPDT